MRGRGCGVRGREDVMSSYFLSVVHVSSPNGRKEGPALSKNLLVCTLLEHICILYCQCRIVMSYSDLCQDVSGV